MNDFTALYDRPGMALFAKTYEEELGKSIRKNPNHYMWSVDRLPHVARNIMDAVDRQGPSAVNRNSVSWRHTCSRLGIKNTAEAISAFIGAT